MSFDKQLSEIYPWMSLVAKRFCKSTQDAEDLVGETVYKLLISRDKFDYTRDIKPWCLVIMQNTYITMYNRNSLVRFLEYNSALCIPSPYYASDLTTLKDLLSVIKKCASKSKCMDSVMYRAEGYSYDEISKKLNIPIGTVRSRISYGRELLLQELDYISSKDVLGGCR